MTPEVKRTLKSWAIGLIVLPVVVWLPTIGCSAAGLWVALFVWGGWTLYSIAVAVRLSWSQLTPERGCLVSLATAIVAFVVAAVGATWVFAFLFGAAFGCGDG